MRLLQHEKIIAAIHGSGAGISMAAAEEAGAAQRTCDAMAAPLADTGAELQGVKAGVAHVSEDGQAAVRRKRRKRRRGSGECVSPAHVPLQVDASAVLERVHAAEVNDFALSTDELVAAFMRECRHDKEKKGAADKPPPAREFDAEVRTLWARWVSLPWRTDTCTRSLLAAA